METKVETTFSISVKVLEKTDAFAKKFGNRSEFVEKALQEFISTLESKNAKLKILK